MGLLEKWTKKKEKEQLDAVTGSTVEVEKNKKIVSKKQSETPTKSSTKSHLAYRIIVKPLVSEKAGVAEMHGTYTFVVNTNATKTEIKQAIKELYGVLPTKVATSHTEGKRVRFGYTQGKRKDWKKAIVTLPKGRTIDIHEGV